MGRGKVKKDSLPIPVKLHTLVDVYLLSLRFSLIISQRFRFFCFTISQEKCFLEGLRKGHKKKHCIQDTFM